MSLLSLVADTAIDPFWNTIQHGGALGVLAVVLWAIVTGRLVPKPYFDAATRDRDEWKQIAMSGAKVAERAVERVGRE